MQTSLDNVISGISSLIIGVVFGIIFYIIMGSIIGIAENEVKIFLSVIATLVIIYVVIGNPLEMFTTDDKGKIG